MRTAADAEPSIEVSASDVDEVGVLGEALGSDAGSAAVKSAFGC